MFDFASRKMHGFNFDDLLDRDELHIGIGLEKPVKEFGRDFFIPGQAVREHPRFSASQNFETVPAPAYFGPNAAVPIIYSTGGQVLADVARWGIHERGRNKAEYFSKSEQRSVARAALIPASFVDIGVEGNDTEQAFDAVRVRPSWGEHLFIACMYRANQHNRADAIALFVSRPGPDLAGHAGWQPVFVPISSIPELANFDFLTARNNRGFQVPSTKGYLKIELIPRQEQEPV